MQSKTLYAGLWPRVAALCIDVLVLCAVFFPVFFPVTRLVKDV